MKQWKEAQGHPNTRVMTQLPWHVGDSAVVYFDRKYNTFWREDRSENGPSSWAYWKLPRSR